MADATFKAKAKLDATPMEKGFAKLQAAFKSFKKNIGQPMVEVGSIMSGLIKKTAIAGTALSGIGVKNAFDDDELVAKFQATGMAAEDAAKRYQKLTDMSMQQNTSAFDTTQWAEAALVLRRLGGDALDNNEFLTSLGDSAKKSGKNMLELATTLADFYSKASAGRDVAEQAVMLMRGGIISEDAMKKITAYQKAGEDSAKIWGVVKDEMAKNAGTMAIFAQTGYGQITRLKTVLGQSFGKVFDGFSEKFKDVMFYLSNILEKLYNDGTLERWGNNIAEIFGKILNYFASLKTAWDAVGEEIHDRIKFFGTMAFALFAGLRTGLLQALLKPIAAIAGGWMGFWAMMVGAAYVAGKAIAEALSPKQLDPLAKHELYREYKGRETQIESDYSTVGLLSKEKREERANRLKKNDQWYEDAKNKLENNTNNEQEKWEAEGKTFGERFKIALMNGLTGGLGTLNEITKELSEIKPIKFPEMPRGKTLPEMLQSGKLVDDLKNAQKLSKFNLRGIYSRINFSPDRIVQNALRVQTPNSRANEQVDYLRKLQLTGAMQTSLTVAQNNILNEIKNNTATKIAVVV